MINPLNKQRIALLYDLLNKIPIAMRITFILLFAFILQLKAEHSYSQQTTITLDIKNSSVEKILQAIEERSEYYFLYNSKLIDVDRKTDIRAMEESIASVLNRLFDAENVEYEVQGTQIILHPKEMGRVISASLEETDQQQNKKITGTVVDASGEPIIGANIVEVGTANGTVTDINGSFTIATAVNAVIRVSFIGYLVEEIDTGEETTFNIVLQEDARVLEDVVVTALGIKRAQKALSYNVQQVESELLTGVKDVNFINSLSGKVAGVTINASSAGVGGASKVVMRGVKSIEQSSNALYVIDGIPMYNFGGGGGTEFGSKGETESIADINPEDIESLSVLTGAAAALYGSNAANGAIVITTKRGQAGKLQVSVSSNTEFANTFVLPRFQNRYGTGSRGRIEGSTIYSWGPLLNDAARTGYEPRDFFDTGMIYTNSVTISTGTEKNQTFFSAASVNSEGIVPNNRYNRFNFTFRNTTNFLNDKMRLDVGASYIIQNDRNMINQGVYSNPIVPVYLFPRGDDFSLAKMFERWDPARKIMTMYWPQGEGDLRMQNPYWIAYRNLSLNDRKRYMLTASLSYDVTDWLNLSGRVRMDNSNTNYEQKLYASSNPTLTEGSSQVFYAIAKH